MNGQVVSHSIDGSVTLDNISKTLEVNIPKGFEGLTSLGDFRNTYQTQQKKIDTRYKTIYNILLEIQRYLATEYINTVDPIQYLIYLHYNEGIPYTDISIRLQKILGEHLYYTNHKTLWKTCKNTFKWAPKDEELSDVLQKKRLATNNTSGCEEHRSKQVQTAHTTYKKKLTEILSQQQDIKNVFSKEKLEQLSGKNRKILYILSIYYKRSIPEAYSMVKSLVNVTSSRTVFQILKKDLQLFLQDNNISIDITKNDIYYIDNKLCPDNLEKTQEKIGDIQINNLPEYATKFEINYSLSGFQGLTGYQSIINSIGNEKNGIPLKNRLILLKEKLEKIYVNDVDPIDYLIYLYYQKQYCLKDVSEKLSQIGVRWHQDTLNGNISSWGWQKRSAHKPSIRTQKKYQRRAQKKTYK